MPGGGEEDPPPRLSGVRAARGDTHRETLPGRGHGMRPGRFSPRAPRPVFLGGFLTADLAGVPQTGLNLLN